ncbi:response regulator [Altererythrobacter sp.]|uniref:hybrid sensor histidine kinase/response regulator n=1 Tax=Altererythrobacter sp. TaxID=1872480 RepID=UPI001B2A9F99|nr:response regulator [Altererythrobacter sp.]MBO6697122.1 response regulator [Henriciella sp.]MBO6608512.1 response regulator [Altererythrobacter sp.]MBO6641973.1 response regulator [Altererythrobacter sp.]MBO6709519.1 response regulator [Altererythrobacter sp.]MBO6944374.1 response regulator [Altererythrobacter sp.]
MASIEDLPVDEQARILKIRLERAERALHDAETALEGRMRELDRANTDLSRRESELVKKLDIESRKLLAAQSTAQMATIYGEKGKPFTASEGAGALLGLPDNEEGSIEKLVSAIHPLDRDRILRDGVAFFTTLSPGIDHKFEHRIVRYDDASTRWLSWVIRREAGIDDRPSAVYGTVRDITYSRANERAVRALQLRAERRVAELNKLSRRLAEEQAKTSKALAVKTQFLSDMAHAIRTPLNSLNGGLELLAGQLPDSSPDFGVVREAADRLAELASKLIDQADTGDPEGFYVQLEPVLEKSGDDHQSIFSPKVLLAEDTESNRYVIERLLKLIGCETTVVTNGVEAVEAVRAGSFDAILMDVMMPIMDGEQATQAIRAMSGSASQIPIIGVTAHSLRDERERLLSAGMTACLSKPVKREELETAIRTAMIGREAVQPLAARFDHELFQRAFFDLPEAYRERMRSAAKKDISDYGEEVLNAAKSRDSEAFSRAAHSLKGVSLNVGAVGIVEELSIYREALAKNSSFSSSSLRREIASSLLAFDDLYNALVSES